MTKGLDWEAAAKRDHIREHGSIPYWVDLPKPKSLEWRPEQTTTGKALAKKARSRLDKVVAEFAQLSAAAKLASADEYRERVRRVCADERRSVHRRGGATSTSLQTSRRISSARSTDTSRGQERARRPLRPRAPTAPRQRLCSASAFAKKSRRSARQQERSPIHRVLAMRR
jgi:hypothetical protein